MVDRRKHWILTWRYTEGVPNEGEGIFSLVFLLFYRVHEVTFQDQRYEGIKSESKWIKITALLVIELYQMTIGVFTYKIKPFFP